MKEKWGILAGNTGWFKMDDVEVPEENLLGQPGEGFKIAMFALDQGRYTVAAGATGLIRACRDASVKYAKERQTFGVEIGQHQLVKEMIAQMESDYQAARLLWLRSGWLKNEGRRNTRETGLAKWFATVASERAAGDAVQIHGANGYSDEYPVGRFYRNCKGAVIYEGTREIHKLMQADYLLGYRTDRPTRCELPPSREVKLKSNSHERTSKLTHGSDLSLEFLRVVEQAAIACAHTMGQGDRHRSDQVAVEAMRQVMDTVPIDGTHRHRRRRARRGADALHRREGRHGARDARHGVRRRLPAGRHRRRSARGHEPVRDRRAERHRGARGVEQRRPAARARSLHGEAGRRPELEGPRQPRRAGRTRTSRRSPVPRPRRRGPRRHRARSRRATRS